MMYRSTTSIRFQWLAVTLISAMTLPMMGCGGDSHEKVIDDMVATVTEMGEVLNGIKSVDDAKAAVGKIESLAGEMQAIGERAKALGEPSPEVAEKIQGKAMEMMGPIMSTAMKLASLQQDGEIGPVLGDALGKFESAMESAN